MFLVLRLDSSIGELISSQVLSGVGFGAATQISFLGLQVILSKAEIASGTKLITLEQRFLSLMVSSSCIIILLQFSWCGNRSRNRQ